jgi:hypothetical protein
MLADFDTASSNEVGSSLSPRLIIGEVLRSPWWPRNLLIETAQAFFASTIFPSLILI